MMAKDKSTTPKPSHVLIFVEGETDEVFFKALMDYYASISDWKLPPYDICNLRGVTRYTSKLLAKLKNEYLPSARNSGYKIKAVCCAYDTDVFEVRQPQIVNWSKLGKSVKRMGIEQFVLVSVRSSIEDWILDDMDTLCDYLNIKKQPKSLQGGDGYHKMMYLYSLARKTYKKGYETRGIISALNFGVIREKRKDVLTPLEVALGINA